MAGLRNITDTQPLVTFLFRIHDHFEVHGQDKTTQGHDSPGSASDESEEGIRVICPSLAEREKDFHEAIQAEFICHDGLAPRAPTSCLMSVLVSLTLT